MKLLEMLFGSSENSSSDKLYYGKKCVGGGGGLSGRGYVQVVKFLGGLCPLCKKISGEIMSMLQKTGGGGGVCPPVQK